MNGPDIIIRETLINSQKRQIAQLTIYHGNFIIATMTAREDNEAALYITMYGAKLAGVKHTPESTIYPTFESAEQALHSLVLTIALEKGYTCILNE